MLYYTRVFYRHIIQHFGAMIKLSQPEHFVNHNQSLQQFSYCFVWHEKENVYFQFCFEICRLNVFEFYNPVM